MAESHHRPQDNWNEFQWENEIRRDERRISCYFRELPACLDLPGEEAMIFDSLASRPDLVPTGSSPEICENAEKIPVRPEQIQGDERCVFRSVGSHLYVYMKKDTFTLSYMDIDKDGRDLVYRTEDVKYKQVLTIFTVVLPTFSVSR